MGWNRALLSSFGVAVLASVVSSTTLPTAVTFQPQIPSLATFTPQTSTHGSFILSPLTRIIVDSAHGATGSPSAFAFAQTFHDDLASIASYTLLPPVELASTQGLLALATPQLPVLAIVVDPTLSYTLFNGKPTEEGYDLDISTDTLTVRASAPLGAWWGMRTVLQQAALALAGGAKEIAFPPGHATDAPGWEIRGFMLDAGRHWFDTTFLGDLCTYASFFKINEFHIHASDNLWDPNWLYGAGWRDLYAAVRFQPSAGSPIAGLVPRKNESWTKSDFLAMQERCALHGVRLVPEIDTPGHSLAISQWKPELMEAGEPDNLNLSYPDTIPTIKAIWSEFLPWFTSPEVSIGADEYDASLADDYISFVNEMSGYIHAEAGKAIRVWGTYEPSKTMSIEKNVTIQHWDFPDDDVPVQLMQEGYSVINSEQTFLYLDGKTSDDGQFPQELDQDLIWGGAPGGAGWAPNIFTTSDPANNTTPDAPLLRGSIMALWNDWGNNATTALEIYYQLACSLAVFGEKTWAGSGVRASALTRTQFDAAYPLLNAAAPGQNLNRVVKPLHGDVVLSYEGVLPNGFSTPVQSVGPPYTLTFSVKPSPHAPATGLLFSGTDCTLHVSNLTFEATGQLYNLGYSLPADTFTTVAIHATRDYTYAVINGDEATPRFWTTTMDIWGEYMAVGNMSFAAPTAQIGGDGFSGTIKDVTLVLEA